MKRYFLLIFALCTLFVGCKHIETIVEKPVYVHDTTTAVSYHVDTVYTDRWHYIDRKGDTVRVTDSVTVYKARYVHDTVRDVVETPVTVTQTVTREVERPMRWWQKTLAWAGVVFLLIVVGSFVFMFLSLRGRV